MNVHDIVERAMARRLRGERGPRVVMIWGAGPSIPCGVPGGYFLLETMRRDLRDLTNTAEFRAKVADGVTPAAAILADGATEATFEEVMEVFHRLYGSRSLHEWLLQFMPKGRTATPRLHPTFAHEYAAHLAGAGLIDVIISLNFDEILEETLRDELGTERLRVVASLSEFERLQGMSVDGWGRELGAASPVCVVLKPHGTISRPLSLRHRTEQVRAFEGPKAAVLRDALRGAVVVLVGFGYYNENFRLLLAEALINGLPEDVGVVDPEPRAVTGRLPRSYAVHAYSGTADAFFDSLEQKLTGGQEQWLRRQKPTRHRLRAEFFSLFGCEFKDPGQAATFRAWKRAASSVPAWWFDLRLYELELLIHLVKTRGLFIDVVAAYCPRIAEAYRRCVEAFAEMPGGTDEKIDLRPHSVLARMLGDRVGSVKAIGSLPSLQSHWCFLRVRTAPERLEPYDPAILLKTAIEEVADRYERWLRARIDDLRMPRCHYRENLLERFEGLSLRIRGLLDELWGDFDVDVTSRDLTGAMRFKHPRQITSRRILNRQTSDMLRGTAWTTLRLATVSGEWLVRVLADRPGQVLPGKPRRVVVVSSLEMFELIPLPEETEGWGPAATVERPDRDELFHFHQMVASMARMLRSLSAAGIASLDWYCRRDLEDHMTICSAPGETPEVEAHLGAIHFWRRGRSTAISPSFLDDVEDLAALTKYFDESLMPDPTWLEKGPTGRLFAVRVESDTVLSWESGKSALTDQLFGHLKALLETKPGVTLRRESPTRGSAGGGR